MRIAYLLADHGIPVFGDKGASVHVRDFAGALDALGHQVTLFCAKRGRAEAQVPFELVKVAVPPAGVVADEGDPLAARRAKEQRYQATARAMAEKVMALHQQVPFDAIYERYSLWSTAGLEVARALGLPLVVEVNAPLLQEQQTYRRLVLRDEAEAVERAVFSRADALVVVSRPLADYVVARGADPRRVEVVPNGVDRRRFHPRVRPASLSEAEGRVVIAFAGSLKAWHGVELLFDAFRELHRRLAGLHLLVIGEGPLGEWLRGYVRGAGLQDRVTFTGWRSHDEVARLLARADLAVAPYPALDDFYFSPLKLFEYLALGKAVVASDIGQIAEVVEHGRTGLLVPPGDLAALVEALEALVVDPALRQRMGVTAATAAEAFTWEANARRVEKLIRRIEAAA